MFLAVSAQAAAAHAVPPSIPPISVPGADSNEEPVVGVGTGTGAEVPSHTLPLLPIPIGCTGPAMPHVVFVGEVVGRDFRSVSFAIESVRSGSPDPFVGQGQIAVRYGLDAQYLTNGQSYLVSAIVHPDLGILMSRVTEPTLNFGGDEVIGISETDLNCPKFESALRSLNIDGTQIDAGVTQPFFAAKVRLAGAFLVPSAIAVAAIFMLAMLRLSVAGLVGSVVRSPSRRGVRSSRRPNR